MADKLRGQDVEDKDEFGVTEVGPQEEGGIVIQGINLIPTSIKINL